MGWIGCMMMLRRMATPRDIEMEYRRHGYGPLVARSLGNSSELLFLSVRWLVGFNTVPSGVQGQGESSRDEVFWYRSLDLRLDAWKKNTIIKKVGKGEKKSPS